MASDHTSATYEQVEKKEKEEDIGEKSVSLSGENEEKGDKCEDEAEGKDRKVEIEKTNDSLAMETSAEDDLKTEEDKKPNVGLIEEGKIDDSSSLEASVDAKENNLRIEDKKLDADVVEEEKIDDSLSSEASAADNLKVQKQLILESPPITEEEPAKSREDNLKTEEDLKPDAALVEEEKIDDFSSSSAADNLSVEKQLISEPHPTEEDNLEKKEDNKPDIALVEEENIDGSLSLEASVADNLKAEKQLSSESPPTEEELVETKEYKEPHTPDIPTAVNLQVESEAEALKETENSEVQEKPLEPEKKFQQEGREEQLNIEATPNSLVDPIEKPSVVILDTTRDQESDAESVVATEVEENPSESEKLSFQTGEEEQPKTVIPATSAESTDKPGDKVEDHPSEHSHAVMAEEVKEKGNDAETKKQLEVEFASCEGTSDDIKVPIPSKEEEETRGIAEKFVEEVGKKEKSCSDAIEVVSKEVEGVLENPEANKTDRSVEEKVVENDVAEGLPREAETAKTEEEHAKLESDQTEADNEKEEKAEAETKVDEISPAVSEPVRETLASKLEKKEEEAITVEEKVKTGVQIQEPPAKESDATKTSKQIPAKPHQKHPNNILWKLKQSLVKAKKAITGKSPTTKTLSSDTKADVQVK